MSSLAAVDFRQIWPLQAAAATMLIAGGLHFTLTPAHGQILGFDKAALGAIGSAYYVGFLVGSLLNPFAFRVMGHRLLFPTYALIIAGSVAAQAVLEAVPAWICLRALTGLLASGIFAAIESWLNLKANNLNRGRTLSAYSMSNQTALAVSQYVFAAVPAASGLGFYVSAAFLLAMVIPFMAVQGAPPPPPQRSAIRLGALGRSSPVAFAGFVANGLATAPFWTLGPVFARGAGLDQFWIAVFMSLPIFGSLALQYPVARLSDGMDRRLVILPVALCAAAASALVAMAANWGEHWMLFTGIVLFGASAMLINMLASAHMNDRVAPADLTEAAGASFVAYAVAASIGPLAASSFMAAFGPGGLFWHAAIILLAYGLFTATRLVVRSPAAPTG